jgi:hypothetical protein
MTSHLQFDFKTQLDKSSPAGVKNFKVMNALCHGTSTQNANAKQTQSLFIFSFLIEKETHPPSHEITKKAEQAWARE